MASWATSLKFFLVRFQVIPGTISTPVPLHSEDTKEKTGNAENRGNLGSRDTSVFNHGKLSIPHTITPN